VVIHVHEVIIRRNAKTREELIEAEVADILRSASTLHDLLGAASIASGRLRGLDMFDAANITLNAGPPELPGSTNIVIHVVEAASPVTRRVGVFSKTEVRSPIGSICWQM
jgi:outer membrane protein insertion porin family